MPDEVSHMSPEKELVFVAGHKAIFGDKLRYYEHPFLIKRTQIKCPATSDTVTQVTNFEELFQVHAADQEAKEEERQRVLEDLAQKAGLSYQEYVRQLAKKQEKREQEIITRFLEEKSKQEKEKNIAAKKEYDRQPAESGEEHTQQSDHLENNETADHRTRSESTETIDTASATPARAGDVENKHQARVREEMEKKNIFFTGEENAAPESPADAVSRLMDDDASILALQSHSEEKTLDEKRFSNMFFDGDDDMDEATPDDFDMDDAEFVESDDVDTDAFLEIIN